MGGSYVNRKVRYWHPLMPSVSPTADRYWPGAVVTLVVTGADVADDIGFPATVPGDKPAKSNWLNSI